VPPPELSGDDPHDDTSKDRPRGRVKCGSCRDPTRTASDSACALLNADEDGLEPICPVSTEPS
jgi:hypothetical protein